MIDDSCKVPRENLDDGFNPCRKQVVENGELCQYAHMYDVMNERYDREDETSYLDWAKRDKITSTTPVLFAGNNTQIYANNPNGEGRVNMLPSNAFNNPVTHTEASIPSAKAVADYVTANIPDVSALEAEIAGKLDKVTDSVTYTRLYAINPDGTQGVKSVSSNPVNITTDNPAVPTASAIASYAPIPLPISKGGTGGNTPYVTDDMDSSAIFVMHDAPNDRYDAAPMSALTNYLYTQFMPFESEIIPEGADLNTYLNPGHYACRLTSQVSSLVNIPATLSQAFDLYVYPVVVGSTYRAQYIVEYNSGETYYRFHSSNNDVWGEWILLYPTAVPSIPNPLPVDQGGTGAQTRSLKTAAGLTLLPVIDSIGASGALNGYTSVTNIATYITTNNIRPEITAAFENHTADAVAYNSLLPTNALMMDYVKDMVSIAPKVNVTLPYCNVSTIDNSSGLSDNINKDLTSLFLGNMVDSSMYAYSSNFTFTASNIDKQCLLDFYHSIPRLASAHEKPIVVSGSVEILRDGNLISVSPLRMYVDERHSGTSNITTIYEFQSEPFTITTTTTATYSVNFNAIIIFPTA